VDLKRETASITKSRHIWGRERAEDKGQQEDNSFASYRDRTDYGEQAIEGDRE
jgi:hypothetical protein